ncbi:3-oxoacyl-ACP synthase III family protein [Undibacterium sp. RuRC25W]|uniref:3-oxoacyl-ACP synthase III family protein n=1 Tax=Undibacterium sp. RuRC25W TaxID=3413047 RepID=UPI003BF2B7A8
MTIQNLIPISVVGLGSYSPGEPITNARLEEILNIPVSTMMRFFGIDSRYFAVSPETGLPIEEGLNCLEMAARASEAALRRAELDVASVDLIITATSTPDHELPPFPFELQKRLGIEQCQILDIRGGCAASMQGLKVAQAMLQAGQCECVLVCGADFVSDKFYSRLLHEEDPQTEQVMNAAVFGDGAGAMILQRQSDRKSGLVGLDIDFLNVTSRFTGLKTGFNLKHGTPVHDHRSMKVALPHVVEVMRHEFLSHIGSVDNIDLLIVPQANGALMELNQQHPLDAKQFYIGNETGNAPAAAIFRALDVALTRGLIVPGVTRVGMMALESASWLYAIGLLQGGQK